MNSSPEELKILTSETKLAILKELSGWQGMMLHVLRRRLGVTTRTACSNAQWLGQFGYVERTPIWGETRIYLAATDKARSFLKRFKPDVKLDSTKRGLKGRKELPD